MSKFGIALMTAAAISLLSGCQAAKEKHPTQEELIRQMQQAGRGPGYAHTAAGQSHAGSTDALRLHAQRGGYGSIAQQRTLPGKICSVRLSLNRSAKLTGLQQEGAIRRSAR
ncbi:cell envelope biogenesis protein TolA [Klebsiella variicola]|nr:cell envelope biogenesis protein TolA [Klebsiella variicola]